MATPNTGLKKVDLDSKTLAKNVSGKMTYGGTVQADDSDISSIDLRISTEESNFTNAKISLDTRVSNETSTRTSSVSSEDLRVSKEESNFTAAIDSVSARLDIENNTTQIDLGNSIPSGSGAYVYSFSHAQYTAENVPVVAGQLRNTEQDGAIILSQLSGAASHTSATFVFSEAMPDDNYVIDIIITN